MSLIMESSNVCKGGEFQFQWQQTTRHFDGAWNLIHHSSLVQGDSAKNRINSLELMIPDESQMESTWKAPFLIEPLRLFMHKWDKDTFEHTMKNMVYMHERVAICFFARCQMQD